MENAIEGLSGRKIAPERLLDNHTCILGAAAFGEAFDDGGKHARRNGEVVQRPFRAMQTFAQAIERRQVAVVAADELQSRR